MSEGVQFGMPPDEEAEPMFEHSILLVHHTESGASKVKLIRRPLLKHPAGELPEPIWLWTQVNESWERVRAPERTDQSIPVRDLASSREDEIVLRWSPKSDARDADMVFRRRIEAGQGEIGRSAGLLSVNVCGHTVLQATVRDGIVQNILPTELAWDLRLWTSHLIQLTQVHVAKQSAAAIG